MKSIALSIVCVLCCFVSETFATGWDKGQSPDGVQCTSTTSTIGNVWYRIRQDGVILSRPSGDNVFHLVLLGDIPEPARAAVASQYDRFVPVVEQRYSQSTLQSYWSDSRSYSYSDSRTDSRRYDTSDRSNRSDHSQRTQTDSRSYDRHDSYDSSDRSTDRSRSYDQRRYDTHYRDRDVEYRVHTDGAQAPGVIVANNYMYRSEVSVDVHPVSETATMAAFAENRMLLAEVIAARRESARQMQQQQQTVIVNCGGSKSPCVTTQPQQHLTTLYTQCWRCGTYFIDQYGRRWHRTSGSPVKPFPTQLQGTMGSEAHGRLTFTTTYNGSTVVFVTP